MPERPTVPQGVCSWALRDPRSSGAARMPVVTLVLTAGTWGPAAPRVHGLCSRRDTAGGSRRGGTVRGRFCPLC